MSRVDLMTNFAGKYVFIGESGTAIHDTVVSPVTGTSMDGVELHAHVFDSLLQNKILHEISPSMFFGILIVVAIISSLLYFSLHKFLSPIFIIIFTLGCIWIFRYLYDVQRILIDIFPFFIAGV